MKIIYSCFLFMIGCTIFAHVQCKSYGGISRQSTTSVGKNKHGLNLLKNMIVNIRKIRASFAFKENKVYYLVRFCGKKEPFCFMTNIYDNNDAKINKPVNIESVDIVTDINVWMKLISTLNGKNNYNITPVMDKQINEHDHNKKCGGKYFFINKGPSQKVVDEIWEESKKQTGCSSIVTKKDCTRTCLKAGSDECHEIRIHCSYGCKCYKKVNLRELRNAKEKKTSSLS